MELLKHQKAFVESTNPVTILRAGIGAGKTTACQELIDKNQTRNILLITDSITTYCQYNDYAHLTCLVGAMQTKFTGVEWLLDKIEWADMVIADNIQYNIESVNEKKYATIPPYELLQILSLSKKLYIAGTFGNTMNSLLSERFYNPEPNLIYAYTRNNHALPNGYAETIEYKVRNDALFAMNGFTSPIHPGNSRFNELIRKHQNKKEKG